jgi:hypothetical protein
MQNMHHSGSRVMQGQFLSRVKNQAHESNDLKLKLFSKQSDSMSKLPE